jgi:hypothetical protein
MTGKVLCFICSENVVVFKEYNIAKHFDSKHKGKYKNCFGALRREKSGSFKTGGLIHRRMSSENVAVIVPGHCGQVIIFLSCWPKEANIFPMGNS